MNTILSQLSGRGEFTPREASLQPCPLSGFRIQADQGWRLLLTFSGYQLLLGGLLTFLFLTSWGPSLLGRFSSQGFLVTSLCYTAGAALSFPFVFWRRPGYRWQAGLHLLLDLIALPLIIYACGGLESGFGILLAVSVTAAGLLIGGQCAIGFAALASLAILGMESYADLRHAFPTTHYSYAGMLGMSYFAIALLAISLARMAEQSEALARQRGKDLAYQRQLNEFIIQNLQSGIIVLDAQRRILLTNDSARRLLALPGRPHWLEELPDSLTRSLLQWPQQAQELSTTVANGDSPPLHVRFSRLQIQDTPLTMIYLEDDTLHQKRVQEGKLASLGRLTAGIAHEIRNPLGAISHAAQLLAENDHLPPQDQRLVHIIGNQVRRLDDTIGNVLQLSRRNAAKREKVCLNTWLETFCRNFQNETRGNHAPLRLQTSSSPMRVWADPSHLEQILSNLCHNALKYGGGGDTPIQIRLSRDEEEHPRIEVIDHGRGIPPQQISQVFEPFFTTSPSGTGLGLYISRELAQMNQARLVYDNGPAGSRFSLVLEDADQVTVQL